MTPAHGPAFIDLLKISAHDEGCVMARHASHLGFPPYCAAVTFGLEAVQRLLHQGYGFIFCVVAGCDEIPFLRDQRFARIDGLDLTLAVAEAERARSVLLSNDQRSPNHLFYYK